MPEEGVWSMADTVRRKVVVKGEVQGVFFRESTEQEAQDQGVSGWVANRDDGAVEAVFEGESEAVENMVEWCRSGPSSASVDRVDSSDEEPEGLSGFEQR
ncbi:MAG: acylphosphatase [Thermoleophilaceae bacterium]